ncbi:MAG: site-2 protease family protein [Patescibacteria group bacterium]
MTILLFIIALSLLILVHEWGHFYAARKFGVRVEEFGFGFPPKIISTVKNGTKFVFNLFPIGGYVKIYGEGGEGTEEKESFASRPIWQRVVIVSAGVIMNLVLAWVFFSMAHVLGITSAVDGADSANASITVIEVEKGSPAESAGIKFGDSIQKLKIQNTEFTIVKIEELQKIARENAGSEIALILGRNGDTRTVQLMPRKDPPRGSGPLGIALEYIALKKTPFYLAPWEGLKSTYYATRATIEGLAFTIKNLVFEGRVPKEVSGPVGIFVLARDITELGKSYIFQFIAILSINLAVLNFLPIPALDGGRVLFMIIEKIRRRAISPTRESIIHAVGFVVLILLMILVTVRDVRNLF